MIPISICLITKNEEKNMELCLKAVTDSFKAQNVSHEIVVLDTGSTDQTVSIAESYGAKVFHFTWIQDFSAARNYCMECASNPFVLFLDADEFFESVDYKKIDQLLRTYPKEAGCLLRRNLCPSGDHTAILADKVVRLFDRRLFHYVGRIHEQVERRDQGKMVVYDFPLTIYHEGYMGTLEERRSKALRNNELLFLDLKENPNDPYTYYQIAQSYGLLKDLDKEYEYYKKSYDLSPEWDRVYVKDLVTVLGQVELSKGFVKEAIDLFEQEYVHYKDNADFLCMGAKAYGLDSNLPKAIQFYNAALTSTDYCVEGMNQEIPHYNLGLIYEMLQNYDKALEEFCAVPSYLDCSERIHKIKSLPEEEYNHKKISFVLSVNQDSPNLSNLLHSIEELLLGMCHIEFLVSASPDTSFQNLAALAEFETRYPNSVLYIQLEEISTTEEAINLCLSYATADAVCLLEPANILNCFSLLEFLQGMNSESAELLAYDVHYENRASFVIHIENPDFAKNIASSGFLGHPVYHKIFSNALLKEHSLTVENLIAFDYLSYAKNIVCVEKTL